MTDWPPEWTEAAKAWRAERDRVDPLDRKPSVDLVPDLACEVCHGGPCQFPTFCSIAAESAKHPTFRRGGHLPDRWWAMSENQLGNAIDRAIDQEWRDNQARNRPSPVSDLTRNQRRRFRTRWSNIYADGVACGLTGEATGDREPGGYPKGFHDWPLDQRNAWFAGFNHGYSTRKAKR